MNEYTLLSPETFDGKSRGERFTLTLEQVNEWIGRGAKLWAHSEQSLSEEQSDGQSELFNKLHVDCY